ncbi:uncharacterized protein MYCFIDRAFT_79136 [Pseudocercospora fijiensis CIRAD86]|uniref:Mediator of RNA polymerase II transcription subunit 11 n=1 Tax=Pseudocercospora fijiensis (strain CIRAD86) TaxID=383855 RepID=M3AK94_PSEFD|nr:uncharacterized protein MYCFIDRAFT_79136 [Pseudocercospora fijiensis CIRAD86]EME77882.1 hypothetical protein MYCFIDRAFT_79136 [Pseudocercospora fijiensis CIRAD86]
MAPAQKITPAERIRELSDINKDVAAMLASAGQAVHALTNRPLHRDDDEMDDDTSASVDDRKQAFEASNTDFLEALQGVMARLRRQAYALEEAGIITPDPYAAGSEGLSKAQQQMQAQNRGNNNAPKIPPTQQLNPERIKNGGLGNFDVGWLNSRGNKVGAEKEAELIQEAKELLAKAKNNGDSIG